MLASDKVKMGKLVFKPLAKWVGYAIATTNSGLNVYLLYQILREVLT
ncbi:hypothetical protein IAD21_02709 [Abditibacteriota bacterium]|nr:hypothetical protein IAD21_02709 [Abditibacteriota bacterium]